jgi:hypothetical protein
VRRLIEEERVFFSAVVLSFLVFVPSFVVSLSLFLVMVIFLGRPLLLLRKRAFSCAVDRMLDVDLHFFFCLLLVGDDVMLLPGLDDATVFVVVVVVVVVGSLSLLPRCGGGCFFLPLREMRLLLPDDESTVRAVRELSL